MRECLNGLVVQHPQLQRRLGGPQYEVRIPGFEKEADLTSDTDATDIHLYPHFDGAGGGSGGFVKIAIGALLIATVIMAPHIGLAATTAAAMASTAGGIALSLGISLVLGGLLQLLSPVPQVDSPNMGENVESSKYLGAPQNTVKIGTRIPLIFGTMKVYGHYLSFNIDAHELSDETDDDEPSDAGKLAPDTWFGTTRAGNPPPDTVENPPQPDDEPPFVGLWPTRPGP